MDIKEVIIGGVKKRNAFLLENGANLDLSMVKMPCPKCSAKEKARLKRIASPKSIFALANSLVKLKLKS